jgi:hypothetical protein
LKERKEKKKKGGCTANYARKIPVLLDLPLFRLNRAPPPFFFQVRCSTRRSPASDVNKGIVRVLTEQGACAILATPVIFPSAVRTLADQSKQATSLPLIIHQQQMHHIESKL